MGGTRTDASPTEGVNAGIIRIHCSSCSTDSNCSSTVVLLFLPEGATKNRILADRREELGLTAHQAGLNEGLRLKRITPLDRGLLAMELEGSLAQPWDFAAAIADCLGLSLDTVKETRQTVGCGQTVMKQVAEFRRMFGTP